MSFPNKGSHDSWFSRQLDVLRLHLSRPDALIQLAFLGLFTGLLAGGIIVLFRVIVEETQAGLLQGNAENYEALSLEARFLFPVVGSLLIAVIFRKFANGIHVSSSIFYISVTSFMVLGNLKRICSSDFIAKSKS